MRKINNAPETRGDEDLYYQYSRSERLKLSRFTDGRKDRSRRYNLSKLLLFDLFFLFIIGGIILPFLIQRNMKDKISPLIFEMELRRDDEDILVSLHIRNSGISGSGELIKVELISQGIREAQWEKVPPEEGEQITLRHRLKGVPSPSPVVCRIIWNDREVQLNGQI